MYLTTVKRPTIFSKYQEATGSDKRYQKFPSQFPTTDRTVVSKTSRGNMAIRVRDGCVAVSESCHMAIFECYKVKANFILGFPTIALAIVSAVLRISGASGMG